MPDKKKTPDFKVVTYPAAMKKRVQKVPEKALAAMLKTAQRELKGEPRMAQDGQELQGIYLLPQMGVLEIYADAKGSTCGFLFSNLDMWLSFPQVPT